MHWLDKQLLVSVIHNGKMAFYIVNTDSMNIEEKYSP